MDPSDPIIFLIGIDLFLSCNLNVSYCRPIYGIHKSGERTFVCLSRCYVGLDLYDICKG